METVTLLTGRSAVNFHYLKTLRHICRIHECYGPRNGRCQLACHFGRIDNLRSDAGFQPEDFGDPVLPELRFRHSIDCLQNDVALPRGWSADQQGDPKIRIPVLTVSHEQLADVGEAEIVCRRVWPHYHGYVAWRRDQSPAQDGGGAQVSTPFHEYGNVFGIAPSVSAGTGFAETVPVLTLGAMSGNRGH